MKKTVIIGLINAIGLPREKVKIIEVAHGLKKEDEEILIQETSKEILSKSETFSYGLIV